MSELSLDYLAGFFDGEGCIGIASKACKPDSKSGPSYVLNVQVTQIETFVLEEYKRQFGGSICTFRNFPEHKSRCKPYSKWHVASTNAYNFLLVIYPYLQQKRPQAILGIEYYESTKMNSLKRGPKTVPTFSSRFNNIRIRRDRKVFFEQIKELNKRGI